MWPNFLAVTIVRSLDTIDQMIALALGMVGEAVTVQGFDSVSVEKPNYALYDISCACFILTLVTLY